ncbi:MAG: hypothetical protein KME27_12020 [Lyngbya sp. HA4199-MV5]|nr:hypothetical protein [Lyngbya sp. HA4199-MV5]
MKEELLPLIEVRCDRTKSVSLIVSTGILRLTNVAASRRTDSALAHACDRSE